MNDKQFRRLGRAELIDMIYQLRQNEINLKKEIAELTGRLDETRLKAKSAGSLAQLSAEVNGLLQSAQRTADGYMREIVLARSQAMDLLDRTRENCAKIIAAANGRADEIIARAQSESLTTVDKTYERESKGANALVEHIPVARH